MNLPDKIHERWMREAVTLAKRAMAEHEVPMGAVVVFDGQIIGRGWNQTISRCDPTAHAEIVALREAAKTIGNYRLVNAMLYVTTEPCTMCVGALIHARIREVIFATREPKAGAIVSTNRLLENPAFNHRIQCQEGVLADEASTLLQTFFQQKRRH